MEFTMPHVPTHDTNTASAATELQVSHTAQFQTTWPQDGTAVVAAFGELDAAVPVIEAAVDVGRRNGGQAPGAE